jgi:hypothetical protein
VLSNANTRATFTFNNNPVTGQELRWCPPNVADLQGSLYNP